MALGRFAPSAPDEVDKQYPRCLPLTVSSVRQQDTCSRNLTLRLIDDQCVLLVDNVRSALLNMTAFKDLRDFLQLLETQKQLLRIVDEVSLEPDLAAAGRAINQVAGENSPAIHFTRLKGYQNAEVVMNVHGSWPNLALVLETL